MALPSPDMAQAHSEGKHGNFGKVLMTIVGQFGSLANQDSNRDSKLCIKADAVLYKQVLSKNRRESGTTKRIVVSLGHVTKSRSDVNSQ